jgi:argininosuccinate synthase
MSSNTDRVALAFSGGLDTTVCVPLLEEEYDYDEVIGVTVNVGQPEAEFDEAEETAAALDLEHYVVNAKGRWSIDTNLWSRAVEGSELEDPSYVPPEDIYEWTQTPSERSELVEIEFEEGYPVGIDGTELDPPELIERLNEQAGAHGIGRTDVMEDRMLGLKVRENYEHPAATVLLNAHAALEDLVLTKEERSFKKQVDHQWAEKAYQGLVNVPLVEALEGFIERTNERATGTVTVKLEGGQARPVGRESEFAVYSAEAASFDTETVGDITQADATGVAKYHGFQERLANAVRTRSAAADSDAETVADGGGADPDATGDTEDTASTETE